METKPNPFSIYDFLGYLIPGAIFSYGLLLVIKHTYSNEISLQYLATKLKFSNEEIYLIFVLLSYVTGHVLSFLSSITVERYSIWSHGYPSKYLLGIKKSDYFPRNDKTRCLIRGIVVLLLFPIVALDWLLGEKVGMRNLYAKPLDRLLVDVIVKKLDTLMTVHAGIVPESKKHGRAMDADFFRYAYHYAVENAHNHFAKMQNYVALYGFLRTLTLISVIVFWDLLWHVTFGVIPVSIGWWLIFSVLFLSYILFMGFVKFYRRFSLEALMAMAVTIEVKGK